MNNTVIDDESIYSRDVEKIKNRYRGLGIPVYEIDEVENIVNSIVCYLSE